MVCHVTYILLSAYFLTLKSKCTHFVISVSLYCVSFITLSMISSTSMPGRAWLSHRSFAVCVLSFFDSLHGIDVRCVDHEGFHLGVSGFIFISHCVALTFCWWQETSVFPYDVAIVWLHFYLAASSYHVYLQYNNTVSTSQPYFWGM